MLVSIRSHLLMLVLAILMPALLGASWLVVNTIQTEREANERTLHDTARALAMLVDHELEQRAALARVLSQSSWLEAGDAITPDAVARFGDMARHSLRGVAGWIELRAAGRVLLDTRQPPSGPIARADLPPLSAQPVVQSLRAADGSAARDAALVEPVLHGDQAVLNVIVGLPAAELQRIVDAQSLPAEAMGTVLDAQGIVMAHHPSGSAAVGRPAATELRQQLAARREGLFETAPTQGQPTVAYFNTTPQGWTYVTGIARERYNGLFSSTVQQVLLGTLVLVIIAGVAAVSVSRRIVEPVTALKDAARRMQAGEPVQPLETGIVECDEVGRALADASEAIQDNRAELQRQVADAVARTRLAEQRVSQGQRVGALGRLTGGVAHDFNNLLGIISNNAHLIQRHPASAELQRPIASTLRAVEVGSQLTQHLLRFAGRRPVRPQRVQLAQYLPEVEALMRSMLGQRVKISVAVAPDTAPVHVDPGELELALINLGLNARDAMPDGGELRLQARTADALDAEGLPPLDPPRPWVMLTVSDDGEGIDPELVERVFEPFFTTKGPGKGSGLGLSQVHGFCVQAGGVARLDSTPGLGTSVSMLLPASEGADAAAAPSPPAPAVAAPLVAGLRVLVVEDNDELGDATAALLRAHGAQVVRVAGADPALAHLHDDTPFDVVLSDIVMPGEMDGYALAQWIRQHRPALPVVLVSGYHQVPAKSQFKVLTKPCPQDDLLAALRDAAMGTSGTPGTSSASGLPGA